MSNPAEAEREAFRDRFRVTWRGFLKSMGQPEPANFEEHCDRATEGHYTNLAAERILTGGKPSRFEIDEALIKARDRALRRLRCNPGDHHEYTFGGRINGFTLEGLDEKLKNWTDLNPIVVRLLESPGGNDGRLAKLIDEMKCGGLRQLIIIAAGDACSAAAGFLTRADWAVCSPSVLVRIHGRQENSEPIGTTFHPDDCYPPGEAPKTLLEESDAKLNQENTDATLLAQRSFRNFVNNLAAYDSIAAWIKQLDQENQKPASAALERAATYPDRDDGLMPNSKGRLTPDEKLRAWRFLLCWVRSLATPHFNNFTPSEALAAGFIDEIATCDQ